LRPLRIVTATFAIGLLPVFVDLKLLLHSGGQLSSIISGILT
jgi:hypothetical protein